MRNLLIATFVFTLMMLALLITASVMLNLKQEQINKKIDTIMEKTDELTAYQLDIIDMLSDDNTSNY